MLFFDSLIDQSVQREGGVNPFVCHPLCVPQPLQIVVMEDAHRRTSPPRPPSAENVGERVDRGPLPRR